MIDIKVTYVVGIELISTLLHTTVVDCLWSTWSDWTPCSKTCGDGVKDKSRQVQTPAQNTGAPCNGPTRQVKSCNDQDCPGKLKDLNTSIYSFIK